MNSKQKKRKRLKATAHVLAQAARKQAAIHASLNGKSGKPTPKGMAKYGYVPNGRGGWRPIISDNKDDGLTKGE